MVWRCNNDKIDGVRAGPFRPEHLSVAAVGAPRVNAEALACLARPLSGLRKSPRHELNFAAHFGRHLVHGPDECPRTSAYHAHSEFARHRYHPFLDQTPIIANA